MAFMCRPSPVFIEIAQKIAVWNGTWASNVTNLSTWSAGFAPDPRWGTYARNK